jgi:hypothetical protein
MGNLSRAVMRRVMAFAVKTKRRKDNPMLGIEAFKVGEHHTWTDAELKQFETKWRFCRTWLQSACGDSGFRQRPWRHIPCPSAPDSPRPFSGLPQTSWPAFVERS